MYHFQTSYTKCTQGSFYYFFMFLVVTVNESQSLRKILYIVLREVGVSFREIFKQNLNQKKFLLYLQLIKNSPWNSLKSITPITLLTHLSPLFPTTLPHHTALCFLIYQTARLIFSLRSFAFGSSLSLEYLPTHLHLACCLTSFKFLPNSQHLRDNFPLQPQLRQLLPPLTHHPCFLTLLYFSS